MLSFGIFFLTVILLSYSVTIQFKNIFIFDRKCLANCWFKEDSWIHKALGEESFFIIIIATFIAFFMVTFTLLNLITINLNIFIALFSSILLTYQLYVKQVLPHLKKEASSFYIKFISSFIGSFGGLIVLFILTMFSLPEFNTSKDLFENINEAIYNQQSFLPSDFKILLLYTNFDAFISTFTWFGMLKLSETFDKWIVLFAWSFFIFSKIGFFITLNFIVLSIKDTLQFKFLKQNSLNNNIKIFSSLLFFVLLAFIAEYTLSNKKILDIEIQNNLPTREIPKFTPNITIDFSDINNSLNTLQRFVKREASPSLFGYQLTAINTRIDNSFEKGKLQIKETLDKTERKLNEELEVKLEKANQDFIAQSQQNDLLFQADVKRAYQLKTNKDKKVYQYIFREN